MPDKPFRVEGDITRVGSALNVSCLTLGIGGTELLLDAVLRNFPHLDASRIRLSVLGDAARRLALVYFHTGKGPV